MSCSPPPIIKRITRALVRFEDVVLRYGAGPEVLRNVSFHLEPGSFHFLAGPSGAGKSSLLKLMYLACRPSSEDPVAQALRGT